MTVFIHLNSDELGVAGNCLSQWPDSVLRPDAALIYGALVLLVLSQLLFK